MSNQLSDATPCSWHVFRSDVGRLWATREDRFPVDAEQAGAARTVDADDELSLARAIAEQEACAEMVAFAMRQVAALVEQQLAALAQTYPAWDIDRVWSPEGVPGGWVAKRRAPLTHSQRSAGLLPIIVKGDAPGLVMALAVQGEIAQAAGGL